MTHNGQEQWVRIFDVPEVKLHKDGFTIYKIVSTLLHRSFPEASTSLQVWRRYSAILRFHREIIKLCNHLQLPESPPTYYKPSLINRFDEKEIEFRRKCTLALLRYCAKYPSLFASEQFTKFFQDVDDLKNRKLSFGRNKKKKSSVLASSLGVSERGVSLYAQLSVNLSSSEDLSGQASQELVLDELQDNADGAFYSTGRNDNVLLTAEEVLFSGQLVAPVTDVLCNVSLINAQDNHSTDILAAVPTSEFCEVGAAAVSMPNMQKSSSKQDTKRHSVSEKESTVHKATRVRTAEYIQQRAGQLMAKLSLREVKFKQNKLKSGPERNERSVKYPTSYMKNYRVMGCSESIIIAVDTRTEETVAVKVIEKSSDERPKNLILPLSVPFMVPIIRYHETDYAVYLVLKYVSGGKLWNHLKKFIKQPSPSVSTSPAIVRKSSCTYEGQRFIFDDARADGTSEEPCVLLTEDDDVSEVQTKTFSFSANLVIDECKSSVENYPTHLSLDRLNFKSSLSNIVDVSRNQGSRNNTSQQRCDSKCLKADCASKTKSKSLEELNSVEQELMYKQKTFDKSDNWGETNEEINSAIENGSIGSNIMSGVSDDFICCSFNHHHDLEFADQNERETRTDTASLLPSPSMTEDGTAESLGYDINHLIQNSKKLIENVNKTLELSKKQIIQTHSSSKDIYNKDLDQSAFSSEIPVPQRADDTNNYFGCTKTSSAIISGESIAFNNLMPSSSLDGSEDAFNPISKVSFLDMFSKSDPLISKHDSSSIKLNSNSHNSPEEVSSQPDEKSLTKVNQESSTSLPQPHSSSSLLDDNSSRAIERRKQIPEGLVRVWVSQVISAMDYLHQQEIIWGNFNPSNLLLDEGGSILVTYKYSYANHEYFLADTAKDGSDGWLSSQGYFAPELFNPVSVATRASDWWSVGALLYHLLVGKDVASCHPCGITSHTQLNFLSSLSAEATSLISNLLCAHPMERLGSGISGLQELKDHPFFYGIEWPT